MTEEKINECFREYENIERRGVTWDEYVQRCLHYLVFKTILDLGRELEELKCVVKEMRQDMSRPLPHEPKHWPEN